jgi:hypothetical protein
MIYYTLRPALFAACLLASLLTMLVSQAEAMVTQSAAGPLCRIAARCAGTSFRLEAPFGGHYQLQTFFHECAHLRDCVRIAASAEPHADIALLAHILFEC